MHGSSGASSCTSDLQTGLGDNSACHLYLLDPGRRWLFHNPMPPQGSMLPCLAHSRDRNVASGGFRLEKWEVEEKWWKTREEETCEQGKYVCGLGYMRGRVHENDPCALAFHQRGTRCGLWTQCWQWGASAAEQGRASAAFLQEVPAGARGQKDQLCTTTPTSWVSGAEFASLGWPPLLCWAIHKDSLETLVILVDTLYYVYAIVGNPDCEVVQAVFLWSSF